jgi:ribosome-associated protein
MTDPSTPGPAPSGETLTVAPGVVIPLQEFTWRFSTSGGPGGQHVNTSNTRAEVSFDIASSPSLPAWARDRLTERLGDVVTVGASDRRSQVRNRELALTRLAARLAAALEVTPPRRPTRPTLASQRRRIETKRRRGNLKRERRGRGRASEDDGS